ncbi:hypothetical protein OAL26_03215 [Flavobacteriales bacterium]|nr:hypothetical protein [Flavobacteriales bacterium]
MKWDVKIALYLFLAYALYGISYLFSDGGYVVPLPMLFILMPIVSMSFFFTSGFNKYSIFFLLLPLGAMSDWISQINSGVSGVLAITNIAAWAALGLLLFFNKEYQQQANKNRLLYSFPVASMCALLFLLNNPLLNISVFLLIGITTSLIIREDEEKYNLNTSVRRLMILSSFISWMYLITVLSVYLA